MNCDKMEWQRDSLYDLIKAQGLVFIIVFIWRIDFSKDTFDRLIQLPTTAETINDAWWIDTWGTEHTTRVLNPFVTKLKAWYRALTWWRLFTSTAFVSLFEV